MSVAYSLLTLTKLLGGCNKKEKEIDVFFQLKNESYLVCLNLPSKITGF